MSSEHSTDFGGKRGEEDTMKILLATDCHLGYELSTKRSQDNDSFTTFEEILQHAVDQDVDFILLGGDLFHDSKPPQKVILQCMELLKKYTQGEREIRVEFLSNPEVIFAHSPQKIINYEDPNVNISMPVFSIHGNHDNPSFASTGSMDILGASGLINYFGKWSDLTHITIPPMLFRKGKTYVSIYGLSYINDQRLFRILRDQQLTLIRPVTPVIPFNILTIHQNRARHTQNGYVDEENLPGFLDLVFWGHEHECRVEPEKFKNKMTEGTYHICQPGSSVATSLCEGEAIPKKIGILQVHKRDFKIQKIKLETVRPFVFDSISLREMDIKPDLTRPHADVVCEFVDDYIENILMAKAQLQLTGHPNQPTIPLIRLRVFYSQEAELFDTMRITRKYCDKVANPRDIVLLRKEKIVSKDSKIKLEQNANVDADINECFRNDDDDVNWNKTVQGQIQHFFDRDDKKNHLTVLSVGGLNEALKRFVEAGDDDAFEAVVNHQSAKCLEYMKQFDVDEEDEIVEKLIAYRDERNANEETGDEEKEVRRYLDSATRKVAKSAARAKKATVSVDSSDDEANNDDEVKPQSARGRGRGSRARGSSTKTTTTRGRGSTRKPAATRGPLDVSFSAFAPKANSSIKPTSASASVKDEEDTTLSQFRARPSQRLAKQPIFVEDSDSE